MTEETTQYHWPMPKYQFELDWGIVKGIPFQEVSGLDAEAQPFPNAKGTDPAYFSHGRPGSKRMGTVTLKKGLLAADHDFWALYERFKMKTLERETLVIRLLDEAGNPTMSWTLQDARPRRIVTANSAAAGNEMTIECLELSHEGLTPG